MIDLLKAYIRLGSPLFVVLVLAAAVAWLAWRREGRGVRRLLLVVLAGYWCAATPIGARALAGIVGYGLSRLPDAAAANGADTIVVMGGGENSFRVDEAVLPVLSGESALRALEGARVYKMLGHGTVIVTGGRVYPAIQLVPEADVLRRAIVEAGVPSSSVIAESSSRTTREQALYVGDFLKARGTTRFVLVTSKTHMRRSLAAFRALGFDPIPSVSPLRSEQLPPTPLLLPTGEWLALSDMAIYDTAALVYYWWKGWI
jgi:uncharacterized SAM-binding protein YcdF (DUF218 family)